MGLSSIQSPKVNALVWVCGTGWRAVDRTRKRRARRGPRKHRRNADRRGSKRACARKTGRPGKGFMRRSHAVARMARALAGAVSLPPSVRQPRAGSGGLPPAFARSNFSGCLTHDRGSAGGPGRGMALSPCMLRRSLLFLGKNTQIQPLPRSRMPGLKRTIASGGSGPDRRQRRERSGKRHQSGARITIGKRTAPAPVHRPCV